MTDQQSAGEPDENGLSDVASTQPAERMTRSVVALTVANLVLLCGLCVLVGLVVLRSAELGGHVAALEGGGLEVTPPPSLPVDELLSSPMDLPPDDTPLPTPTPASIPTTVIPTVPAMATAAPVVPTASPSTPPSLAAAPPLQLRPSPPSHPTT